MESSTYRDGVDVTLMSSEGLVALTTPDVPQLTERERERERERGRKVKHSLMHSSSVQFVLRVRLNLNMLYLNHYGTILQDGNQRHPIKKFSGISLTRKQLVLLGVQCPRTPHTTHLLQ